ncbi:MAG: sigma-70 family RNA polymerase sigma factor [Christensenellales bacterium]
MHRVEICGVDTGSLPKLSNEESQNLLKAIKQGDKTAKDKFVMGNIRLVLSVVQRFGNKASSDDLFQVGMVGLMKAIDGFDSRFNVRFSTYAVPMVVGEIRRFVKESSGIKVSRSMRDIAYKALKTRENIETKQARTPSLMEVAQEIDVPLKDVVCALDAVSDTISLQEQVYNDGEDNVSIIDQIGDQSQSEEIWTDKFCVKNALSALNDKEREVILLRYFAGKTQVEISAGIGISQAQVSRLEKNALSKMKVLCQ